MAPEPSSPDPLQDLDGPSIYGSTPVPRAFKRTSSTAISPRKNKKLSHTTVVSTPTRSPWRIRVVVEAERDSGGEEEVPAKRSRTTRTKTTKVPLRGLSPSPLVVAEVVSTQRKKATPARRRRRSTTATPGGPGKTPAKNTRGGGSVTPLVEEPVDIDEGIGSMMDGMGVLEGNDAPVPMVPMVVVETRPKAKPTPRKTPSKTPRKSPRKTPAKKPPTVASSSKAPPPPLEEPEIDFRSALSPVNSNRMLSPTPSPRKRRSPPKATQPPPRPSLMDLPPSSQGSNDDDMEGFSMVDTGSLLPDFINSISQRQDQSTYQEDEDEDEEAMDLPDFTFISDGASYSPQTKKHGPTEQEQEQLFEDDPVGTETFYGAPSAGGFRSSPPPAVFQRLAGKKTKETPVPKPLDNTRPPPQPQLPQAGEGEKPAASSSRKRKRDTPDLDSTLIASEGLRSSMGVEDSPRSGRRMSMSMTSEKFGGELDGDELDDDGYDDGVEDDDTDVDDPDYPVPSPDKGKSKENQHHTPHLAPPRAAFATEEEETLWADKSPEKSVRFLGHEDSRNSPSVSYGSTLPERTRLEASWAAERAAVTAKAREVGVLTINDDEIEEDSVEAERIVEDIWQAEAEPRSEASPVKGRGERTLLLEREWQEEREEVKRRALEVGAVTIHDTVEVSHSIEEEEEGDSYGAAPGGTTTLLNQDTAAFEESLFHREQQQMAPQSGNLFTSSSTPYKRGSSLSDGQETVSSKSSPPPTSTKAAASRRIRVKGSGKVVTGTAGFSTSMGPPPRVAPVKATAAVATAPTITTTTAATKTTAVITAKERREARAKKRADEAAAATKATQVPPALTSEEAQDEGSINMLPDDLLTPPLSFTSPTTAAARTQVATPPTTNTTTSTIPIDSPPSVGPAWEKRHWRLLERFLRSSKTIPAPGSRLTYSVSIDDPSALDEDPDALLADPELNVTTMEGGERALVLGGKEVEAVRRFRERMKAEGSEREQWGVDEVAAKVGALVLAGVRRRRRAEKEERERIESRRKGKERETARVERRRVDKGKGVEEVVDKGKGKEKGGRAERIVERERRRRGEGPRPGTRLSDWL